MPPALVNRRYYYNGSPMSHPSKTFDFEPKSHHARKQQRMRALVRGLGLALGALVLFGLYSGFIVLPGSDSGAVVPGQINNRRVLRDGTVLTDTLVIYIFSNTDPEYIENLRFFAQFGMKEGDGCDYIIVVQEDETVRRLQGRGPAGGGSLCEGRAAGNETGPGLSWPAVQQGTGLLSWHSCLCSTGFCPWLGGQRRS